MTGQELYLSVSQNLYLAKASQILFSIVIESSFCCVQGRKRIIDGVYKMGVKFRQARETIHIAIEMIDRFYLS